MLAGRKRAAPVCRRGWRWFSSSTPFYRSESISVHNKLASSKSWAGACRIRRRFVSSNTQFVTSMAAGWEWIAVVVGLMLLLKRCGSALQQRKLRLPPGPAGLPLLGNLHIFTNSKLLPHHGLTSLAKTYGPVMFLRLGSAPCVVLSSPEACRDMYRDKDQNLANRPVSTAVDHLLYGGDDIGFLSFGPKWKYLR